MTCRRVITGFSTQTLHSFFKGEIPEIFPATFRHLLNDPPKLPQKTRGKGHSFTSSGPSVWVSKFPPFLGGFFWEAKFSDPVWRIQGTKNLHLFSKKEILSLWNVFSVHHCANEVSLVFKFATYILFGETFLGKPVSVGNVYNLKYTNLHQTRLSVLPGRRSSWRSQLFSRTSSQPGFYHATNLSHEISVLMTVFVSHARCSK